jgi:DNA primase
LTPEQVKLVGRFAHKVLVNYDGDRAGVQAAKRAIETILAEDIEVKVLVLPDNADPDDFIRKNGVSEYNRRRGEAQPHIQFVIEQAIRDRNLNSPADKAAAVEETLPFIRAVRSRLQKREYFDIAMDGLRVQREQRRELWQQVRGAASADGTAVQKVFVKAERPTVAEEKLLGLLVANDELRNIILPRLEPTDYEGLATAAIFRALKKQGPEEKEITFEALREATADDRGVAEILPRILINEPAESFDESLADANSCLNALRLLKLDRDIEELTTQIAEADRAGEDERRDRLVMEKLALSKRRSDFLPPGNAAN